MENSGLDVGGIGEKGKKKGIGKKGRGEMVGKQHTSEFTSNTTIIQFIFGQKNNVKNMTLTMLVIQQ